MSKLEKIVARLQAVQPDLQARYHLDFLGVFGSYVRGEAEQGSDVDILVSFCETPTLFEFVRLQNELSDVLQIQVDLVMKSGLKPAIGKRILAEVVAI